MGTRPKVKNTMKLTFALFLCSLQPLPWLRNASSTAEPWKSLPLRLPQDSRDRNLSLLRTVFARMERVGLAVERSSVWLWNASPVLAQATPWVSTNASWTPLVLAATVQTVFVG